MVYMEIVTNTVSQVYDDYIGDRKISRRRRDLLRTAAIEREEATRAEVARPRVRGRGMTIA